MIKKIIFITIVFALSLNLISANYSAIEPNEVEKIIKIGEQPISPSDYQKYLGKGMDVDWSKTNEGRKYYNEKAVVDFKEAGIDHVRIRIKDPANDETFKYLDKQIDDCINNGVIPIIAYQADEFKVNPTQENINEVVKWWTTVAERYKDKSYLLTFNLIIEPSDSINKQPEVLNDIYEQLVTAIRETNPSRIIIIAPTYRSDPNYLQYLKIPSKHNNYLMAEWHFYAAGPDKINANKKWTKGTSCERKLITDKIKVALAWQEENGVPTWVGAWMPSNYNDGNSYTMKEQIGFSKFMTTSLENAKIPFALNSDTKFYARETNQWLREFNVLFNTIFN